MNGKDFKKILLRTDMSLTEIAGKLGMSTQALNSIFNGSDVRTGIVERCIKDLQLSASDFFPTSTQSLGVNYGAAFGSKVDNINQQSVINERYIDLIEHSSRQLDASQEQLAKAQEQIGHLLAIIEKMNDKK